MRRLVTGIGGDGKSSVDEQPTIAADLTYSVLYEADLQNQGILPAGVAPLVDLKVGPGAVRWFRAVMKPNQRIETHRTHTVDLVLVVEGSVDLVLDDGTHSLDAGDCVAVTGVDHGWVAGTTGCVMIAVILGAVSPPSARGAPSLDHGGGAASQHPGVSSPAS
jgi:quercetin dioxygenase-like cupin family protein